MMISELTMPSFLAMITMWCADGSIGEAGVAPAIIPYEGFLGIDGPAITVAAYVSDGGVAAVSLAITGTGFCRS